MGVILLRIEHKDKGVKCFLPKSRDSSLPDSAAPSDQSCPAAPRWVAAHFQVRQAARAPGLGASPDNDTRDPLAQVAGR